MTREEIANAVADIWGVTERRCDGNHPKSGCEWEKALQTADMMEARASQVIERAAMEATELVTADPEKWHQTLVATEIAERIRALKG